MKNKSKSLENKENEENLLNIEGNKIDKKKDQQIEKKLNKTNKSPTAKELEKKIKEEKDNDEINTTSDLTQEIENLKDERLRMLAEMENIRKRSNKDKIDSIRYGSANLAKDILSISDNLSRALSAISSDEKISDSTKNLIDGLKMVQKEFMTILKKHGVEKIEAIEKKFDHNYHQAVFEIETDDFEQGIVVQEVQTGFMMYDRLLRPSMVAVSKKPENKKKNQEKD